MNNYNYFSNDYFQMMNPMDRQRIIDTYAGRNFQATPSQLSNNALLGRMATQILMNKYPELYMNLTQRGY